MSTSELKGTIAFLGLIVSILSFGLFNSIRLCETLISANAKELVELGLHWWELFPLVFVKFLSIIGMVGGFIVIGTVFFSLFKLTAN